MKVILHIGTEKTGTSSIQHYLHQNRRRLPKHGYHLLQAAGKYDQRALPAYTRSSFANDYYLVEQGIKTNEEMAQFRANLEKAIDEELTSLPANIHSVIISSEHFHSTLRSDQAMDRLRDLLSKYFQKVDVICYLREQGEMCTSWYSTALKFGVAKTLESFIQQCHPQNYYFNYWQLLSRWEGAFGHDALDVAIYDKSEFRNGNLIDDFTGRVDPLLLGQLEPLKEQANQSLSPEGQRLLLGVNCAFPRTQGNLDAARVSFREEIYRLLKGRGRQLELSTRKSIYASFLESNTAVQEKYFPDRTALFVEPDQEPPHEEEFSDSGRKALERVNQKVKQQCGDFLSPEEVARAQALIENIYLGRAGIPFSWGKVHLFSKGILQTDEAGALHALVVVRNTAGELLEFSQHTDKSCSLGWQVLDAAGRQIKDLCGTVRVDQTVPAGDFKMVSMVFKLNCELLKNEKSAIIEFSIVDGDEWLNQKHPLNSAWSMLVLPG